MSDANEIKIIEYNDIDSITLDIPLDITNISVNYENTINDINIEYINEISDIILSVGNDIQSVYSVNGLTGYVTLTASATLPNISSSAGIYSYIINHNLEFMYPIVSVYDINNQMVIADIESVNTNSVKIKSLINLNEYKVVIQR